VALVENEFHSNVSIDLMVKPYLALVGILHDVIVVISRGVIYFKE